MRWVVPIAMVLAAVGWILCEADLPGYGAESPADRGALAARQWRRTRGGWEKTSDWQPPEFVRRPPFHPAMLAAFEVWTAVAAVVCLRTPRETGTAGQPS